MAGVPWSELCSKPAALEEQARLGAWREMDEPAAVQPGHKPASTAASYQVPQLYLLLCSSSLSRVIGPS
jgi:hypothetical protein